jgi:hypothetical protein
LPISIVQNISRQSVAELPYHVGNNFRKLCGRVHDESKLGQSLNQFRRSARFDSRALPAAPPRSNAVRLRLTGKAQSGFAATPVDVPVAALPFRIEFK